MNWFLLWNLRINSLLHGHTSESSVKLWAQWAILLSNEHLQQFIHSSLRKIVLSCKLKQINLILRPGYTVSLTLQTSSVLVLSRFNPRILVILVPVRHRWRHNHDGPGPLMSSIYSAVFCVIGTDSLARTAPRSSDFKTAVDFCLSCTRSMTWSRLRVW